MDIVERLRKIAEIHFSETGDWCEEAADEIERLRWENANMEKLWGKSEGTWMEIRDNQNAEIERLRDVLEDLMAVQNGPPLTAFQSEWMDAMIRANDMLYEGTERKGDRGQR